MDETPKRAPRFRRTWIALLVGVLALTVLFVASIVVEHQLIVLAIGEPIAFPRRSAGGWADSNVWLAATAAVCIAMAAVGYLVRRLSPVQSPVAVIVLLALMLAYLFFAQFPGTRSAARLAFWFLGLPAGFVLGAWLGSRQATAR